MAKESKIERRDQRYALIMISEKQSDIEPTDVPVNLNGVQMVLKRNEFIPVQVGVVEILKNATRPVTDTVKPGPNGVVVQRRKIVGFAPRFPFQFISWLAQDEYDRLKDIARKRSITQKEADDVVYGRSEADAA